MLLLLRSAMADRPRELAHAEAKADGQDGRRQRQEGGLRAPDLAPDEDLPPEYQALLDDPRADGLDLPGRQPDSQAPSGCWTYVLSARAGKIVAGQTTVRRKRPLKLG